MTNKLEYPIWARDRESAANKAKKRYPSMVIDRIKVDLSVKKKKNMQRFIAVGHKRKRKR